ncbi:MAG: C40 family peptidase [Clostridia bacterium]|nr:C40 family peptidase [Clostridia bacterium]
MKLKRVLLTLVIALFTITIVATVFTSAAIKPDAPVITASNILSSGKNRITWEKAWGASYYYVYRSETRSGGYIKVKSTSSLSYTDNDADVGETYYYCVKSVSSDKTTSDTSNKVKLTCKLPRPVVTLSNVKESGKISVKWTAVEGAQKYEVYRATSKTGEYRLIKTTTATSMKNTSTEAGRRYYYKVRAVASSTSASSAFSGACSRVCKLAQPEITLSNVSETGKIHIEWNKIEGAVSYYVYRSEDKSTWSYIGKSTTSEYTDEEAQAGTKYYYRVKAVASNTSANSAYSAGKSKTCALSQPQFMMSKVNAEGDIILSWKLVRGAKNYRVYRSERKTSGYTRLASVTERSFTDTTVAEGKTYYYKIRAVHSDSAAISVYSDVVNMNVSVSQTMAVSLSTDDANIPQFIWSSVKGASAYKVYRSLYEDKAFSLLSTRTACNYKNSSVPQGLTFYYKIVATNAKGVELATSKVVSFTAKLSGEVRKERYVNELMVNLYTMPDINSQVLPLRYMAKLELGSCVLSRSDGDWYRVFRNGDLYYLRSADINETLTATRSSFSYTGGTTYQQQVIDFAVDIAQNWKTTYAHEQSNGIPDSNGVCGFDCSGFAKYVIVSVMQKYIPVYDISADVETLYATTDVYNSGYAGEFNAIKVDIDELQPGDVIFFTSLADGSASTEIGHCGIYLGNNEFVHSTSSWSDAVCIVPLSGSYLENYAGARRYLPEEITPANTTKYMVGDYYNYNLYSDHSPDSAVIDTLTLYDMVTVLYTDSGNWAYIETENGKKGYVLEEYLGDYVYLDYVELEGTLNEDNKPYLVWNKVKNAVKYDIYRSLKADSEYSLISSTEKTYYTNTSAISGVDLYYKVVALDSYGVEIDTSDYVKITTPWTDNEELLTRYVKLSQLKLYELPAISSDTVSLKYMEEVKLGGMVTSNSTGSWYRAFYNDRLLYLRQGVDEEEKLTSVKSTFTYEGDTQYQQQVIDLALEIYNDWDTVYATGQSNGVANSDGTYGFNAPGLVKFVLNSVMQESVPAYNLSVVLDALYKTDSIYNKGYEGEFCAQNIDIENIQPGDVLFFGSGSTVSYCGLYLGNGEFISCLSSFDNGVDIVPLSDKYSETLLSIRRYLPENITPANATRYMVGQYNNYKLYSERSASSEIIGTIALYDKLTVLYTDSGSWAYIETEAGEKGFVLTEYLEEEVYLGYVELKGELNEANEPAFDWFKVVNAVRYDVYRSLKEDSDYTLISSTENTSYTDVDAISGVDLYYKVVAFDAYGEEIDTSDCVKITTPLEGNEALLTRYVKVPQLNVYDLPTTSSASTPLRYMEKVELGSCVFSGADGDWYRAFRNGNLYYICSKDINETLTDTVSSFSYTGNTIYQQQVIDLAVDIAQNWETIYAPNQSNGVPDNNGAYGFDCSGFVEYVLNSVMQKYVPVYKLSGDIITLYATEGLYNSGYAGELNAIRVGIDALQPGDVLFFKPLEDGSASAEIGHCGIYLGNNEFVHSTSLWDDAVCIAPLSESYLERYAEAVRYLPEDATPANTTKYMVGKYYNYNVYSERSSSSEITGTLTLYDMITVLYTDNGKWAYIETENGAKGFVLEEYLGDYVYLDYVELEGKLNDVDKPFLSWNRVANAVKYDVYRSLKADSEYSLISSTDKTYYTNLSAISGVDLYYKVVACDAFGEEIDASDSVKITTPLESDEEFLIRYVKLPQLKLYDLPTTTANIISVRYMEELLLGDQITSSEAGSWYRVFYNDSLMYLWQGVDEEKLTSVKSSFTYEGNTQYQQQVIDLTLDIAQNWETVYAHGQSNGIPDSNGAYGFDCSGLVKYILLSIMNQYVPLYNLSADVETLYATEGLYNSGYAGEFSATRVDIDELQPGDVLFFKSLADGSASTEIGHCGIYLGNNEFAHSTSFWSDSVCIVSLSGSYLESYVGAVRYLPDNVTPANEEAIIDGPYQNYKVYAEKSADSTVVATLALGDTVTILFTDNGSWAYVETADGTKGYMLLKYLP